MPTKAELYAQMADKVATQLTGSWQEWAEFLTTASRLYKYPFHEQLMIYAQRPDATACAEYDLWNEKMGRYVRRGSKGIALVDDSGDRPRLRYVFDISDTGTREHSRTPWLWQLEERHLDSVQAMLERTYDVSGDDLAGQLTEVAGKLAEEYWTEHQQDFFYIVDGSFLEEYDEFNIGVQFKAAATVSITYALMSRCGLEPERYFDHEDFMAIFDFNTGSPMAFMGYGVKPDCVTMAKAMGGGMPIGACCASEEVAAVFTSGTHGSTYGGHPLACAASLASISEILDKDLSGNAKVMGEYMKEKLAELPHVKEARGKGLLVGCEYDIPIALEVKWACFRRRLLITAIGDSVNRMIPPLILAKEHVDQAIEIMRDAINEAAAKYEVDQKTA